jgi:nucleotide-binding universal stress UspA family protein
MLEKVNSSMFKKILLPVDLSNRHAAALGIGADLALQSGGKVVLLHVIEVIAGLSLEDEEDFYWRLERTASLHLEKLGARLKRRKVPWHSEVTYGNRGPAIVRYARDCGADLIVLTSPKFDPKNLRSSWGSLSYKVGLTCSCPVLLVK